MLLLLRIDAGSLRTWLRPARQAAGLLVLGCVLTSMGTGSTAAQEPLELRLPESSGARPARAALALGLLHEAGSKEREAWLQRAESLARTAVARDSMDLDGLFILGAAIGLRTPYVSLGTRVELAEQVLECSRRILEVDPAHPGGLHLYGQLNAAGMRLNSVVRFVARRVLGSDVLDDASWAAAERAFRAAIRAEPDNPAHRLELAYVLRDTGRVEAARAELGRIVGQPDPRPLGDYYRRLAWRALSALR